MREQSNTNYGLKHHYVKYTIQTSQQFLGRLNKQVVGNMLKSPPLIVHHMFSA